MVTGTLEIEFILHDCHSLKEKRSIVRRIIEKTRNRFNVSIAEIDCLDLCQRAIIGVSVVSNDRRHANSVLDHVIDFMENMHIAEVAEIRMDFF
jgi:uncharacterized protein YlxP (DUF503 family)